MKKQQYDLIVIGSGAGGSAAAKYAARLGAKIALVEKSKESLGGNGLKSGSIPRKALLQQAMSNGMDWRSFKKFVEKSSNRINAASADVSTYHDLGVDTYFGEASFQSSNRLIVGRHELQAKYIIVATGSRPRIPVINGLKKVAYETNETIFSVDKLPKRLAIIGGGTIAVEAATAFQKLGTEVTIIEHNPTILKRVDSTASQAICSRLIEGGAEIYTSASVIKVTSKGRQKKLQIRQAGESIEVVADTLMVAAGRRPSLPKGIKQIGVSSGADGITVDDQWRSSCRTIYAVGDVASADSKQAHSAANAAICAVNSALFGVRSQDITKHQPLVVYSDPEIAQVGAPVHDLIRNDIPHRIYECQLESVDEAIIGSNKSGFIKIVTDADMKVIGGVILGADASEAIGYLAAAIQQKKKLSQLSTLPLPYPSLAASIKQLAIEVRMQQYAGRRSLALLRLTRSLIK